MKRFVEIAAAFVMLAIGAVACLRMGAEYNHFVDERGYHHDWADAYSYGWQRGYLARYKREMLASDASELPPAGALEIDSSPALHVD